MNPGNLIDAIRRHDFAASVDGDDLILTPGTTGAALPAAVVSELRACKPAVVALLRSLPTFTDADERALVDSYCDAPRAARLAIHRAARAKHDAGLPWREADLEAMREHFEARP